MHVENGVGVILRRSIQLPLTAQSMAQSAYGLLVGTKASASFPVLQAGIACKRTSGGGSARRMMIERQIV
jgi:hypothetical protein